MIEPCPYLWFALALTWIAFSVGFVSTGFFLWLFWRRG